MYNNHGFQKGLKEEKKIKERHKRLKHAMLRFSIA